MPRGHKEFVTCKNFLAHCIWSIGASLKVHLDDSFLRTLVHVDY
jgi:hypothetical protein